MADSSDRSDARSSRFGEVFAESFATVRPYVVRRADAAVVDDVLSETFLVAWRRIDAVPEDALPWLLGVARRVLANQRRAQARRGALVDVLASVLPREPISEPVGRVFGDLSA